MHVMGPPRDAYVYHYLFNCSRLVDVVCVLFILQSNRGCNTSYQKPCLKPFQHSQRNIRNLDGRVSSFLMSTRNTTQKSRNHSSLKKKMQASAMLPLSGTIAILYYSCIIKENASHVMYDNLAMMC